jgi:hypothetical protein
MKVSTFSRVEIERVGPIRLLRCKPVPCFMRLTHIQRGAVVELTRSRRIVQGV